MIFLPYLSAGHNLSSEKTKGDPGAVANGLNEADLTIIQRNLTAQALSDMGVAFHTDTDTETLGQYLARLQKITTSADVAVEYHFDAASPTATGCTSIVGNNASALSRLFAQELVDSTSRILGIKNRGVIKEAQSARGKLGFMRLPARTVIVELSFITNSSDLDKWVKNRDKLAQEHALIIHKYDQLAV